MLKKHMAACLIATAFVAAPAFAQAPPSAGTDRPTASGTGSTTSGSPAMQPAPSANSGSGSSGSPGATNLGSTSSSSGAGAAGSSPMGTGSSGAGGIGGTAPIGTAGTGGAASPPPPAPGAPPAATAQSPAPAPAPSATASPPPAPANNQNAQGLGATGSQPASPPPAATAQGGSQNNRQGQFVTQLQDQQIMASKMIGTTVVSANNESIGDINDVVVDRQGKAVAVVIGVGGFLGIGEKDVAVPFEALEFTSSTRQGAQASNNAGAGAGPANNDSRVATTGSTMSNQQDTASNRQTATTGNTGNAGAGGAAQANSNNDGNLPDRIMLRMTKADLQNAPAFQTSRRGAGASNTQKQ
jgi:sporulation protein YlmC with PRC-barrel domain